MLMCSQLFVDDLFAERKIGSDWACFSCSISGYHKSRNQRSAMFDIYAYVEHTYATLAHLQHLTESWSRRRRKHPQSSSTTPWSTKSLPSVPVSELCTQEWVLIFEYWLTERVRALKRTGKSTTNTHPREYWRKKLLLLCSRPLSQGKSLLEKSSQLNDMLSEVFLFSRGVRPFGVSLLVAGWDDSRGPTLYQVDPSGSFWAWKASAIGKNMVNAKTFLEKRFVPALLCHIIFYDSSITLLQI